METNFPRTSLTRILNLIQWRWWGGDLYYCCEIPDCVQWHAVCGVEGMLGGEGGVRCHHGNRASALAAAAQPHHCSCLLLLVCSAPLTRSHAPATVMIRWVRAPRPRHGLPVHHRVHDHHHTAAVSAAAARRPGPAFALLSRLHQTLDQEVRPTLLSLSLSLCLSLLYVLLVLGFKCSLLSATI